VSTEACRGAVGSSGRGAGFGLRGAGTASGRGLPSRGFSGDPLAEKPAQESQGRPSAEATLLDADVAAAFLGEARGPSGGRQRMT